MSISPVINIVNSVINPDITNILYYNHNSFFDLIIKSLDYNFIDDNSFEDLWYNLCISNDPIYFSQNHINKCNNFHINSLLFFHNKPPTQFKKEDILILKRQTARSHKVVCLPELVPQWLPSDTKWHTIDYGIPFLGMQDGERNTDLLVLNLNNNPNITSVYKSLSDTMTSVEMMSSLPNSISDLYDKLYTTKICLDFDNHINSLVAATCGCFCITTYPNNHLFYYNHITNLNLNTFADTVKDMINNMSVDNIANQQQELANKFSFDMFSKRISLLTQSIIKEKVIL